MLLRLYRLSEIPPGLYLTEGIHGLNALQVLRGEHAVFFTEDYGRAGMIIYAVSLTTSLMGRTMLAVRLPAALASAGTVFALFWLGQTLFGREEDGRPTVSRGLLVGGLAAGLLAVSIAQTVLGRTAFRGNFLPLILCLCLALLWRGWTQRSLTSIVLAGICAGLLPYTYTPARFTPFLFFLFGLSFLLPAGSLTKQRVRAELPRVALFLCVTGLVAAPILVHFALHPDHFVMRSNQLLVYRTEQGLGAALLSFLGNAWDHLLAFGFRSDPSWRHNFPGRPMLNPLEALFFWFGLGMAVWRWQRPAYRLLLLWLVVLLLPAVLSRDNVVPHFLRMIGAAPAVYLLIGVGVWEAFRLSRERFFQGSGVRPVFALAAAFSCFVLVKGVSTFRTYFQEWATAPELVEAYDLEWKELARVLNAQPSHAGLAYLIPVFHSAYSFEYLYTGGAPVHLYHQAAPDLAQEIWNWLENLEDVSTVKVVRWKPNAYGVGGEDNGRIGYLLSKFGRKQGNEDHPILQIDSYSNINLNLPWTFYEHLEPVSVAYDGGIALQGLALGQGAEQLSSRQTLSLKRDRPLWMAYRWQTVPGLDVDYVTSLRLYNVADEIVYQEDMVLWNPEHWPTSHWQGDDLVDTLSLFNIPADLPAGEYALRLVVYNYETLVPTVEIGVWRPEKTLAQLHLEEAR